MKKMDKKFYRLVSELENILDDAKHGIGPYQYTSSDDWRDVYASLRSYWTSLRTVRLPASGLTSDREWFHSRPHWANARAGRKTVELSDNSTAEVHYIENSNCARTVRVRKRRQLSRPERRIVHYIQSLNAEIWECWNKTA